MLKMLLSNLVGVPLRKPALLFIVCRVLTAFLLKSNLLMWDKSPKKAQMAQQFLSGGLFWEGSEQVHSDICVRMLTAKVLKCNKDQVTQKVRNNL